MIRVEETLLETDFSAYSAAVAPDTIMCNADVQMACHKKVLKTVMNSGSGNIAKKGLYVGNINDQMLQYLYSLIYDDPNGKFREGKIEFLKTQFESMNDFFKDAVTLITEYKVEIVREFLVRVARQSSFETGEPYYFYKKLAKQNGLYDVCKALEVSQIENRNDERIEPHTFKNKTIKKMIKANNFVEDMGFMDRMVDFMTKTNNRKIAKILNDVHIDGNYEEKLTLEVKKNRMLLACGYRDTRNGDPGLYKKIGTSAIGHMTDGDSSEGNYKPDGPVNMWKKVGNFFM